MAARLIFLKAAMRRACLGRAMALYQHSPLAV